MESDACTEARTDCHYRGVHAPRSNTRDLRDTMTLLPAVFASSRRSLRSQTRVQLKGVWAPSEWTPVPCTQVWPPTLRITMAHRARSGASPKVADASAHIYAYVGRRRHAQSGVSAAT